ncbi:MAG: hypothetical protein CMJ32_07670 [Phycisphaerae bacterium]|nr:hypothetical protein [Phycisphaerae bacterium]
MSTTLTPCTTVNCTIKQVPASTRGKKTILRLMQMQPEIRRGLSMLARRRRQTDNIPTNRAGRIWINRKRATRLTRVEVGNDFTLRLTPQIIPDLQSVSRYLDIAETK